MCAVNCEVPNEAPHTLGIVGHADLEALPHTEVTIGFDESFRLSHHGAFHGEGLVSLVGEQFPLDGGSAHLGGISGSGTVHLTTLPVQQVGRSNIKSGVLAELNGFLGGKGAGDEEGGCEGFHFEKVYY